MEDGGPARLADRDGWWVPWSNEPARVQRGIRGMQPRRETDDSEVMARLAAGEREALEPLMQRHYRRLYRIALAYVRQPDDALDVVQEAFVKAYRNADRWDGRAEAGAWLARITVNLSIDRWRRNKRRLQTFTPMPEGDHERAVADEGASPQRHLDGREARERAAALLERLPEKQRLVLTLRHCQDMSLEEIAATLEMSLGTVKSTLHRALHGLRARLAAEEVTS